MLLPRLAAVAIAAFSLLPNAPAQDAAFTMSKQYSADIIMTTKTGLNIETHAYVDGDKLRSEMQRDGVLMATIVRKDTKKLYHVVVSQQIVMESDFDPTKTPRNAAVFGPTGKFDLLESDVVDGIGTAKYKVTAADGKVSYFWMDLTTRAPVQMVSSDGAMTVKWKNFKPGPQDPKLFEPPASYQITKMPPLSQ